MLLACTWAMSGCTLLSVASTGISIGTPKHGWFPKDTNYVYREELKKPAVPLNLSIKTRYIVQGIDTSAEGVIENSAAWFFEDNFKKQISQLFEETGIALITDRGLDGDVYVEASNTMENLGMRFLPYLGAIRLTERKFAKFRITLRNKAGQEISSKIVEGDLYVHSGLFADDQYSENKKAVFEIPRFDYTFQGEAVALDKLNEQLFLQSMKKIQTQVDLVDFFTKDVPAQSPNSDVSSGDILESIVLMETSKTKTEGVPGQSQDTPVNSSANN